NSTTSPAGRHGHVITILLNSLLGTEPGDPEWLERKPEMPAFWRLRSILHRQSPCQRLILFRVLGTELRKARLAAGLTQEQLAAKARISREYVSALERDQYSPTVDMLLRICMALQISAWTVIRRLERTGKPPTS